MKITTFINRTLDICDATLKEAKLQATDIDQVLLVGGQTRLPAINEALHDRYGWTTSGVRFERVKGLSIYSPVRGYSQFYERSQFASCGWGEFFQLLNK